HCRAEADSAACPAGTAAVFFFQAEDGIRALIVTGVQTCALPIFKKSMQEVTDELCELCGKPMIIKWGRNGKFMACSGYPSCKNRSEERRVGKECRCRRSRIHWNGEDRHGNWTHGQDSSATGVARW